jgi:hypothetical protein
MLLRMGKGHGVCECSFEVLVLGLVLLWLWLDRGIAGRESSLLRCCAESGTCGAGLREDEYGLLEYEQGMNVRLIQ